MAFLTPTQPRHDDIIVRRRFGEHAVTHAVTQIYAVTYPGHTDEGAERDSYRDAEAAALRLAEERGCSVWYEENPSSSRRTFVKSFPETTTEKTTAVQESAPEATRPNRGAVDAPGKRHRKPPPQETIDTRLGEPHGKRMGQKSVKSGWRGGR